jgi:DNA processing protein
MLIHWIWLATRPGMQDHQKLAVLETFGSPEDAYFGDTSAYASIEGITEKGIQALTDKDLSEAQRILDQCIQKDIRICTYHDGIYPFRLKNISDPPLVLYYRGQLTALEACPVIGVVGTRKCSVYGITAARRMGYQIVRCGGMVVSGLAAGIDSAAMQGALTAGGNVIGVLGCGIDVVYPAKNKSLYLDTERNGCLISEFPPETPPLGWNFPRRNRIISGLCNGVLVVEAPEGSGSLITAHRALEQGRDVFVVPGNIDVPTFRGSNSLLREGAIAVSSGWDVVSEYEALYPGRVRRSEENPLRPEENDSSILAAEPEKSMPRVAQKREIPREKPKSDRKKLKKPIDNGEKQPYSDHCDIWEKLSDAERRLLEPLRTGEKLVDELIAESGLSAGKVLSMLTMLQIRGVVKPLPGKRISLK